LIGEHIDYALFGVFPAAVERDILIALAPRPPNDKPGVVVGNAEPKYTEQTFTPSRVITNVGARDQDAWLIDINTKELRWDSYVKAGYYVRSRFPLPPTRVSCAHLYLVLGRIEQLLRGGDE
jgi:galactokinase